MFALPLVCCVIIGAPLGLYVVRALRGFGIL